MLVRRVIATISICALAGCSQAPRTDPALSQWLQVRERMRPPAVSPAGSALPRDCLAQAGLLAVAKRARSSVVRIVVDTDEPRPDAPGDATPASGDWGGSGVILSADGLILTSEHVVRGASRVVVILPGGRRLPVTQCRCEPHLDLAVLRISPPAPLAPIGIPRTVGAGEPVVAIGSTSGAGHSERAGVVTHVGTSLQSRLDPTGRRDYGNLIESTALIERGFSGGPLLTAGGQLAGICVASAGGASGSPRGYAIPMDEKTLAAVGALCSPPLGRPPTR
jgi:S1-C subfamily serine protease